MTQAQIVIAGVKHLYRPPSGRPVLALEEVSIDVRAREFLALLETESLTAANPLARTPSRAS